VCREERKAIFSIKTLNNFLAPSRPSVIKLITAVINYVTQKARVFVKTSKKWWPIAKALAYCSTEVILAVKSFMVQARSDQCYKTFFLVSDNAAANKLVCLSMTSFFQVGVMFSCKARAYLGKVPYDATLVLNANIR